MAAAASVAGGGRASGATGSADAAAATTSVADDDAESAARDGGGGCQYTIEVREKKGWFRAAIPSPMPPAVGVLCALLNCLIPGLGTLITSPFCFGVTAWSAEQRRKNFGINVLAFFLQLATAVVIAGWCWSILWAIEYLEAIRNRQRK